MAALGGYRPPTAGTSFDKLEGVDTPQRRDTVRLSPNDASVASQRKCRSYARLVGWWVVGIHYSKIHVFMVYLYSPNDTDDTSCGCVQ